MVLGVIFQALFVHIKQEPPSLRNKLFLNGSCLLSFLLLLPLAPLDKTTLLNLCLSLIYFPFNINIHCSRIYIIFLKILVLYINGVMLYVFNLPFFFFKEVFLPQHNHPSWLIVTCIVTLLYFYYHSIVSKTISRIFKFTF